MSIMKTLLISATSLLTFTVLVSAKPHYPLPPHKQAAKDACLAKLDITEEKLHDRIENDEFEKERSTFMACIFKELGILDEEGNIIKEEAIKDFPPFVPQENRTIIVDSCFEKKGDDDGETVKLYRSCVQKLIPAPILPPELQKIHDNCKDELSITEEDIRKMMHSRDELESNCFLACIGKGVGFLNKDGTLNKEVFIEKSPPHVSKEGAQKIADECEKEVGTDECETAALLHKCFKANDMYAHQVNGAKPSPPPVDE